MFQGSNMHVQGPQINQFNNISPAPVPRSSFQRDFTRRSTFNASDLVPIFLDEILPGDDVNVRMNAFVRMSTPIKPLMDNLYFETFWFFIPNRLTWDNWERFQGQQTNPGASTDYTIPKLNKAQAPLSTTGFLIGSIYDYFALPTGVTNLDRISALFNRAYDMCWDNWFRDENLQNSINPPTGDGPDNPAIYTLRKRNKRKDYFTSGLPWPQKGDPVAIPLTGNAQIVSTGVPIQMTNFQGTAVSRQIGAFNGAGPLQYISHGTTAPAGAPSPYQLTFGLPDDVVGSIEANLSGLDAVTINQLREAALYQQILELDARGGTRYVESIYSRFGVVSPDFRLQRPELIGQASTRINVYAVPQTAPTTEESPQGNLAAFGSAGINGSHGCRYSATEHGIIIGMANVRADLTYQQGVPRMFRRQTRLDFYEPLLNGLGEQATPFAEIFAQGTTLDEDTHSFQERFAEYRWKNSEITGKFRSVATDTLDVWHLSQEFATPPVLASDFITEDVPMARILATGDTEPHFLMDAHYNYTHVRPMPIRSNPGITRL